MTTSALRFREHQEFHRAALHMTLAGAAAGLIAWLALPGGSPWPVALVAGAAALAAVGPALRREGRQVLGRALLITVGGACLALAPYGGQPALALLGFGALFGAALAWGLRGRRLLAAVALGAGVALIARYCFSSVLLARELDGLPGWMTAALAGAAFSLVAAVALLPRHLELARDPVRAAHQELRGALAGEVAELVDRGARLWTDAAASLPENDLHRTTLQEGVLRLFEVARHWRADGPEAAAAGAADGLGERLATLDARIAATGDPIAREQYEQARDAVREQLGYLDAIGTNRERVLARMHNYLAAMERLRLALRNLESANASRTAVEVQPLVADVQDLGRDIDSCAEALVEVDDRTA